MLRTVDSRLFPIRSVVILMCLTLFENDVNIFKLFTLQEKGVCRLVEIPSLSQPPHTQAVSQAEEYRHEQRVLNDYSGPGFPAVVTLPPSPTRKLSLFLSLPVCRLSSLLRWGGGGEGGRGAESYGSEKSWSSTKLSILSGQDPSIVIAFWRPFFTLLQLIWRVDVPPLWFFFGGWEGAYGLLFVINGWPSFCRDMLF